MTRLNSPASTPLGHEHDQGRQRARNNDESTRGADDAVAHAMNGAVNPRRNGGGPHPRELGEGTESAPTPPLTLSQLEDRLAAESITDRLPNLRQQLDDLARHNAETYGFSFQPDDLTIPEADVSRMLLGLREGLLTRLLVIDSPTAADVQRLHLRGETTMLEYRMSALIKCGYRFYDVPERLSSLSELRTPTDHPLWTLFVKPDGTVDTSESHAASIYRALPATPTIADRTGAAPRLILTGPDAWGTTARLLADGDDGTPVILDRSGSSLTPEEALRARAHFISPEAALVALGAPYPHARQTPASVPKAWHWTAGLTPEGEVARLYAYQGAVGLRWGDPADFLGHCRFPATSE